MKKIETIDQFEIGKYYEFTNLWGKAQYAGFCTKEANPDDDVFECIVITEKNGPDYALNKKDISYYDIYEYNRNDDPEKFI